MSDLPERFRKSSNAGEKIELFFALAENQPEFALRQFANIWRDKANPPMRALALQGLGRITDPHIKQALVTCETDEDLQILRDIANEVKGRGTVNNDLTRWAAAWAIENMGFSQHQIEHLEGGALTDPPYRIRNEIINRKLEEIKQIQHFDSRGELTAEYERHIEFWVYGPTQELFRSNIYYHNYDQIVRDVISELHILGVDLAVNSGSSKIQQIALEVAKQYLRTSTEFNQKRLCESIRKVFLYTSEYQLRNTAVSLLNQYRSKCDREILIIIDALQLEFTPTLTNLRDATLSVLKNELSSVEQEIDRAKGIFTQAQAAAEFLGIKEGSPPDSGLINPFSKYIMDAKNWSTQLKQQISGIEIEQNKIYHNQSLLKNFLSDVHGIDLKLYEKINKTYHNGVISNNELLTYYNQCTYSAHTLGGIRSTILSDLYRRKEEIRESELRGDKLSFLLYPVYWTFFSICLGSVRFGFILSLFLLFIYGAFNIIYTKNKTKKLDQISDKLSKNWQQ
jgi:hypothetical protein